MRGTRVRSACCAARRSGRGGVVGLRGNCLKDGTIPDRAKRIWRGSHDNDQIPSPHHRKSKRGKNHYLAKGLRYNGESDYLQKSRRQVGEGMSRWPSGTASPVSSSNIQVKLLPSIEVSDKRCCLLSLLNSDSAWRARHCCHAQLSDTTLVLSQNQTATVRSRPRPPPVQSAKGSSHPCPPHLRLPHALTACARS